MSRIEWRHDGQRILLPVLILRPSPTTDLTSCEANALLDTGATTSGISTTIARRLGLPTLGKRPLMSAQGLGFAQRFMFRIAIPNPAGESGPMPFVFEEVMGFELVDGTSFEAILGMDILRQCDFAIGRDGTCSLRFG